MFVCLKNLEQLPSINYSWRASQNIESDEFFPPIFVLFCVPNAVLMIVIFNFHQHSYRWSCCACATSHRWNSWWFVCIVGAIQAIIVELIAKNTIRACTELTVTSWIQLLTHVSTVVSVISLKSGYISIPGGSRRSCDQQHTPSRLPCSKCISSHFSM